MQAAPARLPLSATDVSTETLADQLLLALLQLGVKRVFGVPGGAIEPFYDAMARGVDRGEVEIITTRHESAAVTMAEATVREGAPLGVCCATSGPGALNMMSATASALMEQQPVLVLTGQAPLSKLGQGPMQDSGCDAVDVVSAFKAVTKYSSLVSHPQQLYPKLLKALTLARTTPCGPVHLSIPSDVLSLAADTLPGFWALPEPEEVTAGVATLTAVAQRLAAAHRPVMLIGEETEASQQALLAFLQHHPMPVVATAAGHRWFPTSHPLFQGVHGFAGHSSAISELRNSDCILVLGSPAREFCGGNAPYLRGPHVIAVSGDTRTLTGTMGAGLYVHSNLTAFLDTIGSRVSPRLPSASPKFHLPDAPEARPGRLCPVRALRRVWAQAPNGTHAYLDAGNTWAWALQFLPLGDQVQRMSTSMGYGQMAWGVPAAIGAAFERSSASETTGQPTLCVTGDGSWLMCSHELTVAVQHCLPVVFVVLNDAKLGMVYHGQRMTGARSVAHELPDVSFAAMARACGAQGVRVADQQALEGLDLASLFNQPGPTVLELVIDPETVPPMRARVDQIRAAAAREALQ